MGLETKHCKPCEDGAEPLSREVANSFLKETDNWELFGDSRLTRVLSFKNFKEALGFINKVGELAEKEGHHPNITLFDYKKVKIELYTHSIGGLSENDFILASLINELLRKDN